jgi:hypothetical protein
LVAIWALYMSTMMRSSQAGPAFPETLLAAVLFAGPCAVLAFLGMPWRRHLAATALLLVACATATEALAGLEEALLRRHGERLPADSPVVFQARWWPHASSYLYYDPSTGRLGAGD